MRTKNILLATTFFLMVLVFSQSCQDESYVSYMANVPVYLSYEELRESVKAVSPTELSNPGKIYFKDNVIYINEFREGIHVIDNSNPSSPTEVAFIDIPGNVDIAIRDNFLFADSYVDLVVLNISDIHNVKEVSRVKNIFEYYLPEYDTDYEVAPVDQEKGVVVDWEIKETRQKIINQPIYYPVYRNWSYSEDLALYTATKTNGSVQATGSNTFGVGGSMSRFGQYDKYLFTLSENLLRTFEVDAGGTLKQDDSLYINWGMETMFILKNTMFLGSTSAMYIYDLSNLPSVSYISKYTHFKSCDPVIADDRYAYVTLKVGGNCGNGQNLLDVFDISDLKNPVLKKNYPMHEPKGLGKDDDILFVCDGDAGLKVFDASQPDVQLPELARFNDVNAYDVIPVNNQLFLIGDDGFYQYDYSDVQNILLLSKIEIKPANN
ncbi:MAG TPA: hypothetical protein PKH79_03040 [Prolixibacteraceae bacterium]|nr:hypothetical protein [Prolixibacteraceae bacterium]